MILVVSATAAELRRFAVPDGVRLVHCGVGPVEAAIVTADALARGSYRLVINAGIAGVFRGRGVVGDAFVVEHDVLAELGIETRVPLTMPDGIALENEVAADRELVQSARDAGLRVGCGVTVASITATEATARRLFDEFGADVESMEGFAVLRAATMARVPAIEIRGVSNFVGDRSESAWDFAAGAGAVARALAAFLEAVRV